MSKDSRLTAGNLHREALLTQAEIANLKLQNANAFDPTNPDHEARFATLVKVVNGGTASSGSTGGGLTNANLIPGDGDSITVSDTVIDLDNEITLHEDTILVRVAFIGNGDVMVTYNGNTPSSTVGEPRYPGGVLEISKSLASTLKLIRSGTTDCNIYVTQFQG